MFQSQFSTEGFIKGSGAGSVTYSSRIDHRCGHRLLRAASASVIFLAIGINAGGQPVTGSFTHEGRTLKYRYTSDNLPTSGRLPGLLLYFHGHNSGSQEDLLYLSPYTQGIADSNGLVYVKLASPALRDGRLGGTGTRHWHDEDIAVVHEFLQTELPSELSFDSNRIIFWGGSQGTCFLNAFLVDHGTSYGGGLYAQCGCFNLSPRTQWDVPRDFRNRFKVLVQATTGDFLYGPSVNAYWFYKYWVGLDTFGDLSEEGGHCREGAVTDGDAIGWLLGTRSLRSESAGDQSESGLPLRLTDKREPVEDDCGFGRFASERHGDGPALWLPVKENGYSQIPLQNRGDHFRIETALAYSQEIAPSTSPNSVAVDAVGNLYLADPQRHKIFFVDALSGAIETVAGTGDPGYSGDGGPAIEAQLNTPRGVVVDPAGNIIINDNNHLRVVNLEGVIQTVPIGFIGDGARLAVDGMGNVYVGADRVILKVDATTGEYEVVARPETSTFNMAVDTEGNVYMTEYWNHRVLRIDAATGAIKTIAGTGDSTYSGDGGPATEAGLPRPSGIAVDAAGDIYVAHSIYDTLRRIDAETGVIETVAGKRERGNTGDGGPATEARLHLPGWVGVGGDDNVYVASGNRVRVLRRGLQVYLGHSSESVELNLSGTGSVLRHDKPVFGGARVTASNGNWYALSQLADRTIVATRVTVPAPLRVTTTTAQPGLGRISTIAGTAEEGYSGDGGQGNQALLDFPHFVALDESGNLYVTDTGNDRVRRIDPSGVIQTIAGSGNQGYRGDGSIATSASFDSPTGVAVDRSGNVYVADWGNHRVRRGAPSGVIETVAGTGEPGYSGDGGPAIEAQLDRPFAVAVDRSGNVYVIGRNHRVRRVAPSGVIETVAGTGEPGYSGDGGPAIQAQLRDPWGIASDNAGNLYVADTFNYRVRRIRANGVIETVAGTGEPGYSGDGGPAIQARLDAPTGLAVDSLGNVYFADANNRVIRRIDTAGTIETVAGTGEPAYSADGGPATEAPIGLPIGVAVDGVGVYFVDRPTHRVRFFSTQPYEVSVKLGSSGEMRTLDVSRQGAVTSHGQPIRDGDRLAACNGDIYALHRSANGSLRAAYVSERQVVGLGDQRPITFERNEAGAWRVGSEVARSGYRHVRGGREYVLDIAEGRWRLASHALRTVAGNSGVEDNVQATESSLYHPSSVATDSSGNLYVADRRNNRIRRIHTSGNITTLAGTGDRGYSGDGGPAVEARLDRPAGVAVDRAGNVYVADTGNQRVRRIDLSGRIETYAGTGQQGYSGDGGPAGSALFDNPLGVATDAVGNVYVADAGNQRIRRISLSGTVETYAGTGERGYSGDEVLATEARLDGPSGVAVDAAGNVYVADFFNQRVRRIDTAGMITVVAGTGERGYAGDGGAGSGARLDRPAGVAVDGAGNVYVADYGNRRIRRIDPTGTITTVAGTGKGGHSGDGGPAAEARLNGPFGLGADTAGNLFVADLAGHRVRSIDLSGNISTVAGTGQPFQRSDGGLASRARFSHAIKGVAADTMGNVYVADPYDHSVRQIDASETISTFVGTGTAGFGGDGGLAAEALLDGPSSVAVDAVGNVYVADTGNHRVRQIDAAGTVTTFAGTGTPGYSGEYVPAKSSRLNNPARVAADAEGRVYVLDAGNRRVRAIAPTGRIRTVAGNGKAESPAVMNYMARHFIGYDAVKAPLFGVSELALDSADREAADTLYLGVGASLGINLLWSVPLDTGLIGELFSDANRGEVTALAADGDGSVYFADDTGIRVIRRDGSVSIIAESGEYDISVAGLAVDEFGRVWFSDPEYRRVRVLEPLKQ